MAHQVQDVESEALSLPFEGRRRLVLKLLDSIDSRPSGDPSQVQRQWLDEANRRYEAYVRGEEEAMPADQAFAELRAEDH